MYAYDHSLIINSLIDIKMTRNRRGSGEKTATGDKCICGLRRNGRELGRCFV